MYNIGRNNYVWIISQGCQQVISQFIKGILVSFILSSVTVLSALSSAYACDDYKIYKVVSVSHDDIKKSNLDLIKTPEKPIDIIKNIRDIYASGIPIQENFYDNNVLNRVFLLNNFFTGSVENGKFDIIARAAGTPDILKIKPTNRWFPAMYITTGIKYKLTWRVYSVLNLDLELWRPSFEEVKELFGPNWRTVTTEYYDGSPLPPKVEHGDETLLFEFKGSSFKWTAAVLLDENAHLKNLNMYEEAK
jgi:hypothetical protein